MSAREDFGGLLPDSISSVEQLDELLSRPTPDVIEMLARLDGDVLVVGAGGKMGPTLARMVKRGSELAGSSRKVIAVSRFTNPDERRKLEAAGVQIVASDLLEPAAVEQLPEAANILFLAGMKFGATGNEPLTWAMNTFVPGLVARRFSGCRIVAFSTGNVYSMVPVTSGGARESDRLEPLGEYAMSCLGRERMFEYASQATRTPTTIFRLNYACETRYGVLVDLAQAVWNRTPIDLSMGAFNVIWQGDANAMAVQCLEQCRTPAWVVNVTGGETLQVRDVCRQLSDRMGRQPQFTGQESATALLSNAELAHDRFGSPLVPVSRMIDWVADWVMHDRPTLGKATKFQVRDGQF